MNFKRNGSKQLKFVERMILIWSLSEPKSVRRNEKNTKILQFALNEAFCHKINLLLFFLLFHRSTLCLCIIFRLIKLLLRRFIHSFNHAIPFSFVISHHHQIVDKNLEFSIFCVRTPRHTIQLLFENVINSMISDIISDEISDKIFWSLITSIDWNSSEFDRITNLKHQKSA